MSLPNNISPGMMMTMIMTLSVEIKTEPGAKIFYHKLAVRLKATQLIKTCRSPSKMVKVT